MRVTLALLSCTKKCNLFNLFLRISLIWIFQVKSLKILRPSNFTLSTNFKVSPLMRIGSNSCWDFVKDIRISLHLSMLSWTLFSSDHCTTLSVVRRALLSSPFATVSEIVVLSTNFYERAFSTVNKVVNHNPKKKLHS